MKTWKWVIGGITSLFVGLFLVTMNVPVAAQEAGDFSLQVSPSPLVATVKPGEASQLELKIRNSGSKPENLRISPRAFSLGNNGDTVTLDNEGPAEINNWISFSNPTFTVLPGEWFTQKIKIAVPQEAGFSYSFALVINRADTPEPTKGGRLIEGSVAVFTLLNVDQPGATRKLEITDFSSTQNIYEFLPAKLNVRLKNTGNTIVQPYGNIFVQRGSSDTSPLATLPVNETKGYILPGKERALQATWGDGFPTYNLAADAKGVENRSIDWNISNIAHFRIGQYTAKLVAVYNDGQRDVPLEAEITFWVIPWKTILLILAVIIGLWFIGRKLNQRKTRRIVKKALAEQAAKSEKVATPTKDAE